MAELIWATSSRRTQYISCNAQNCCKVNRWLSFKGDRIFIECNDTEDLLVAELVEMGVSQDNISSSFINLQN